MHNRSPLIVHQNAVLRDVQKTSLCPSEYHTLYSRCCFMAHCTLHDSCRQLGIGFETVYAVFGSSGAGLRTQCAILKAICPIGSGTSITPQTCRTSIDSMLRHHNATGSIRIMLCTHKAVTVT